MKTLIVVDMQTDFIDGALGSKEAEKIVSNVVKKIRSYVKKGDRVLMGQMIAEAGGFVSAPVFSSVSGTVKGIEKRRSAPGTLTDAVIVTNDFQYEKAPVSPLPGMEAYCALRQTSQGNRSEYNLVTRSAEEALEYHIIDEIYKPREKQAK